ncbi:hypothetical protein BLNAU_366 [Blattamonas nauphoetae]|uniref:Uncharacterized protein n=1 Tax=Blattamonas nauphoetae TaxID=2049346 RepID=A0ABQ9YL23_9EUKA|nr:hypothetical protein BLNAU_366 [Blattamonas nauphoetae]
MNRVLFLSSRDDLVDFLITKLSGAVTPVSFPVSSEISNKYYSASLSYHRSTLDSMKSLIEKFQVCFICCDLSTIQTEFSYIKESIPWINECLQPESITIIVVTKDALSPTLEEQESQLPSDILSFCRENFLESVLVSQLEQTSTKTPPNPEKNPTSIIDERVGLERISEILDCTDWPEKLMHGKSKPKNAGGETISQKPVPGPPSDDDIDAEFERFSTMPIGDLSAEISRQIKGLNLSEPLSTIDGLMLSMKQIQDFTQTLEGDERITFAMKVAILMDRVVHTSEQLDES